ncbi:MAG: PQQ-dependent sugar dehydrogenase [Oscillospiraceae bacterium]|nr:PQQ-dependent sugar dehydrogenase [Oscillospiraceae bacterium]
MRGHRVNTVHDLPQVAARAANGLCEVVAQLTYAPDHKVYVAHSAPEQNYGGKNRNDVKQKQYQQYAVRDAVELFFYIGGQLVCPYVADHLAVALNGMHGVHNIAAHHRPFPHGGAVRRHYDAAGVVFRNGGPDGLAIFRGGSVCEYGVQLARIVAHAQSRVCGGHLVRDVPKLLVQYRYLFLA